jgi:hypothetical protein
MSSKLAGNDNVEEGVSVYFEKRLLNLLNKPVDGASWEIEVEFWKIVDVWNSGLTGEWLAWLLSVRSDDVRRGQ